MVHFDEVRASLEINANGPGLFPWYLGHICSQWRTTVLSIVPRKLYVPSVFKLQRNAEKLRHATNIVTFFLLNRGRQFDLHLAGAFCRDYGRRDKAVPCVLDLLVAESARGRHVTLDYICNCLAHYRVKDHLSSLQSLRFQGRYVQCIQGSNHGEIFRHFYQRTFPDARRSN